MRRDGQIESNACDGEGFLDQLVELFFVGMATENFSPLK